MKKLLIILFAAAFVMGCSDDNTTDETIQPDAKIEVSAAQLPFLSGGDVATEGQNALTVTSSDKWRLSGKKTWCHPSAIEGLSGETITFTADANPTSEPRSIVYTFICGSKVSKVVATQEPSPVLDFLTDKTYTVGQPATSISMIIKATEGFSYQIAEKDKSWITAPVTRAIDTHFLSFDIAANASYSPRSGSIIFSVTGKEPVTVTVNQAQTDFVSIPKLVYEVDPEGEDVSVAYETNVELVPDLTGYAWITLLPASRAVAAGTLVFKVEPVGKKPRTASIPIKSADGLRTYETLSFSQASAPVTATVTDPNFAAWLVAQEFVTAPATGNKYVLTAKGLTVTKMDCSGQSLTSVAGIEAFTTLTEFNCANNSLTALDLRENTAIATLNCSDNYLKTIDLTKCAELIFLDCRRNDLTLLDLSGCAKLNMTSTPPYRPMLIGQNNLGELRIADNAPFVKLYLNQMSSTPTPLTGRSGVASSRLKIVGAKLEYIYINNVTTLRELNIRECPAIRALYAKGGNFVNKLYLLPSQSGANLQIPMGATRDTDSEW
ncbi:MAG: BACON domain-containing protein [Alistipes sp.]